MSKRIVMSVLASAAMSIGGFFVTCGDHNSVETSPVLVKLPGGCMLVSPRDEFGTMESGGATAAHVKAGKNQFVIACDGRMIQVDKDIAPNQRTITFSPEELQ